MASPRFPIVSRPIHEAPQRFPWMGIIAAVVIASGAYALSAGSTPTEEAAREAASSQTVTR
jgi:hypothetical protein